MTFTMLRITWGCLLLLIVLNNSSLQALPASSTEVNTHIVSYVKQPQEKKYPQFDEFDFEDFRSDRSTPDGAEMRGALQQLFGRFVQNFDTNLERLEEFETKRPNVPKSLTENGISLDQIIDDARGEQVNTLENGFGDNEQHESPKNDTMWHRSKQSIPVLESVRHLVNSVRDGHLNHTVHVQRHRTLLGGEMQQQQMPENTTSQAIETEEERVMINASSDLQFLEVLGSLGSKLWNFLTNIKQVFAASASTASSASSSSSSS